VHATFADPLSDAICGHKDLDIGLEQHVVVIGAGPVGTAHVALALAQGADLVYLLETSAGRLDLARGVLNDANVRYVDTTGIDPVQFIKDETGDGADRVIVACSNVQAQEQAMEMAAPRGRVLYFGGLPKGTTTIAFPSNVCTTARWRCTAATPHDTATRCRRWRCCAATPTTSAGSSRMSSRWTTPRRPFSASARVRR
jgi:Threonine dehydrogenase and related Zn-dependent dehydrogenases